MAENLSVEGNAARFIDYPYDIHETWWCDLQKRKMAAMASRIKEWEVVLDVGTNSGYLPEFVPHGCQVHGIDLSPALVAKALATKNYKSVQVCGAEKVPFPDKFFDVVFAAGVIEYFYDVPATLRELQRLAKRIMLIEACHEKGIWGEHRIASHAHMVRSYNEQTLRAELEPFGKITWVQVIEGHKVGQHRIMEVEV